MMLNRIDFLRTSAEFSHQSSKEKKTQHRIVIEEILQKKQFHLSFKNDELFQRLFGHFRVAMRKFDCFQNVFPQ